MSKYQINKYYLKKSIIHSLNPISKVIVLLLSIILTLLIKTPYELIINITLTLTLILLSKINISEYLKSINKIKVLLIFLFIINIIFKLDIYSNFLSIYKIINILLISIMVSMTTPPTELTYALEKIMYPLHKIIKVKSIALMLTLAIRFIPTLTEQSENIIKSITVRGIDLNGSIKDRINVISTLILPMFTLSIKKSDAISDIMSIRMYNYNDTRTNYRMNKWNIIDTIIFIIMILLLILEIVI